MSGESARHIRLVEALVEAVKSRHRPPRGLVVFADHHSFGSDRPPIIGGFTPDVFASDLPVTFRVVGEAKTPAELEAERSRRKLLSFLDHLALYPCSTFYLAVPILSAPRARALLRSMQRPEHQAATLEVLPCR